ncbi:RluA family pseudouridine synthase [Nitrospirillum sp. BR 11752]|uniref:RluA family pseudouridine synthase n=1 Tax=Nitrospirillum sp. BR 11752 TaxID=3104293 RepID=UPI002EAC9CCB|nr:RluA family pseudouridine synthase [Nitrospirillum sp. BR 11752]
MSEEGGRKVETRTVTADEAEMRLDRWFKRHYPALSHIQLEKLLRTGQVRVDGGRVKGATRLEAGQSVRIPPMPDLAPLAPGAVTRKERPLLSDKEVKALRDAVLYRDSDVIVLNKPAGLAVQGGTGQNKHLDAMLDVLTFDGKERPKLVHRLDKDTSGCLVLARSSFAATRLAGYFRGKDARKYYWAVTVGVPKQYQGKIDAALAKEAGTRGERMAVDEDEGARAVTLYQVIENAHRQAAFVALWPLTGRTHQLRAHMVAIGTPILGDGKYGGQEAFLPGGAELPRQLHLHARRIVIPNPRGGKPIDVSAPLPPHMAQTWDYFGFDMKDGDPFASYA